VEYREVWADASVVERNRGEKGRDACAVGVSLHYGTLGQGTFPLLSLYRKLADLEVKVIPIPGSSSTKRTLENIAAADVTITPEEKAEIDAILAKVRPSSDHIAHSC
jgi:hypothetical protein